MYIHIKGQTRVVPGAACLISILRNSPHAHGLDSCDEHMSQNYVR